MGKVIEPRKLFAPQQACDVAGDLALKLCIKGTVAARSRRVEFVARKFVRRYKKNYDEKDYPNMWYSPAELKAIADENTLMVKRETKKAGKDARSRHYRETNTWSWRGLEYAVKRYGKLRVRREHIQRVLQFQREAQENEISELALADYAYKSSTTSGSALRARSHAIRDEYEMNRIRKESGNEPATSILYKRCITF